MEKEGEEFLHIAAVSGESPRAAEAFCFALAKALSLEVEADEKENEAADMLDLPAAALPVRDLAGQLRGLNLG